MYSRLSGLLLGFHGCDASVGRDVVSGKMPLRISTNDYDWLGHGVYFWENSPDRAWAFACDQCKRGKVKTPFVIGAVLDLGLCLNLQDAKYHELLKIAYDYYAVRIPEVAKNRGGKDILQRFLDCAVFESLHELIAGDGQDPFDSVRCAFEEGEPSFSGSAIRDKTHVQICIRNPDCIKGYFLPLELGGGPMRFKTTE